jgi:hypothetical protein
MVGSPVNRVGEADLVFQQKHARLKKIPTAEAVGIRF